jgi:hypothetical protein
LLPTTLRIRIAETLRPDGAVVNQNTFMCETISMALPIALGGPNDQTTLVLFGTGIRNGTSAKLRAGDVELPTSYAGPQNQFPGLDQVNIPLPQSLRRQGDVSITLEIGNLTSNTLLIHVQ